MYDIFGLSYIIVKKLEAKLELLSKKLDEKKNADELAEFERVRKPPKRKLPNIDILTLKAPIMTAADDTFCDIFPSF